MARKASHTSSFLVIPLDVWITPQNFLAVSFNPFSHSCKILRPYLVPVLIIKLDLRPPSKKLVSSIRSLYNWSYDNFSHRNTRVIKLWWNLKCSLYHEIFFLWRHWQKLWHLNLYFKILMRYRLCLFFLFCRHYQNCNHVDQSNL